MNTLILKYEPPRAAIGTKFTYALGGHKTAREAEVIGYHFEYNSDTKDVQVQYRIRYEFCTQIMTITVPRSTVDRALLCRKHGMFDCCSSTS